MRPSHAPLEIQEGATCSVEIALPVGDVPADLTDYFVRIQFAERGTAGLAAEYQCDSDVGTEDGSTIAIGTDVISLRLSPTTTAALAALAISLDYEIELYTAADADVLRIAVGPVFMQLELAVPVP